MGIKQQFEAEGYVTGLTIMSAAAMRPYREAFDRLEAAAGKRVSQVRLINLQKTDRRVWELVGNRRVLELMSEVLGPDLLLLGTHFFCCGLTMRFTDPTVRPVRDAPKLGAWRPTLMRGTDRHRHFDLDAPPRFDGA